MRLFCSSIVLSLFIATGAEAEFTQVRVCEDPVQQPAFKTVLFEDTLPGLYRQEGFSDVGAWPEASEIAPGIRECFGTGTPHSRFVLLHSMPKNPFVGRSEPHPVLLVPGAGDNAQRAFGFMSWELIALGFDVYAVTFAQPHGDNYQHAQLLANVIKEISSRHQGRKVDVVAHSMGGIALRVFLSHDGTVNWGDHQDERGAAYAAVATRHEDLVRKVVFLGTPQLGADTSFRWPNGNYTRVLGRPTNSPLSWQAYYPTGTLNPLLFDDLTDFGYFAEPAVFPGQTQVLANLRGTHALPGEVAALGVMALQQDWFTTYQGGLGFVSRSRGIDDGVAQGGRFLEKLAQVGVDPSVELFIAAGQNPILPVENAQEFLPEEERQQYGARIRSDWPRLKTEWFDVVMPWHTKWPPEELDKVFNGRSIFGEVSGPSDGLVFSASVVATDALTQRGARVTQVRRFDELNHLELVYASALASRFFRNQEIAQELYDPVAGAKYAKPENQVVQWIAGLFSSSDEVMADAGVSPDSSSSSDVVTLPDDAAVTEQRDGGRSDHGGVGPSPDEGSWGCVGVSTVGPMSAFGVLWYLPLLFAAPRRHRRRLVSAKGAHQGAATRKSRPSR